MILEVCIDSVESAIAAERGGAERVELCGDLLEGGITPSAGMIASVRRHVAIGLFVMIRPRGGDFCYSDLEFEVMQEEIRQARQLGADGIVLGLLNEQACIDVARTRQLVELARPLPVTFHRAIDMTPDLDAALEDAIATGAERILTSGGAPNVTLGMSQIAQMVKSAKGRITIMPGSGVSLETVAKLAAATGATEYHSSVRSEIPSPVRFRKEGMVMGCAEDREYTRFAVQEERVRALVRALKTIGDRR
ncbi:MAG: copper homeostasis protein CutC [Terracidiphilus sp.]|nr:copper homeostasis protein CutC [Terracidiphilus sp.]